MKQIIGIYKIISPSERIYIGQSRNILYRWKYHYQKLHCKSQTLLYNSLVKYTPNNHKFEILEECPIDMLDEREIYYISLYDATNKLVGLNHRVGGTTGKITSEDTKLKMRNNALGNKNRLGKKLSQQSKDKISISRTGTTSSKETKHKISLSRIGKIHSIETRNKLSRAKKFSRRVKNIVTQIIHESIVRAAAVEGIGQSTIYRGLKNGKYEYVG